jgi:hypothetical protein
MGCLFLILAIIFFPAHPVLTGICLVLAYLVARDNDEWR